MKLNRRLFIKSGLGAGVCAMTQGHVSAAGPRKTTITQLDKAAAAPILKIASIKSPVKSPPLSCCEIEGTFLFAQHLPMGPSALPSPMVAPHIYTRF